MNEKKIVKDAEDFMRSNLPNSRPEKDYLTHVFGVRKYALKLAEIYKADKFIVEVAVLLHDVGADAGKEHADKGAKISKKFLLKLDISEDVKEKIIKCIERHSMGAETETIEERIIQDADGISFLKDTYKSFYAKRKKMFSLEEAKKLALDKTKGMMNKIKTEEGIKIAKEFLKKALEDIKKD